MRFVLILSAAALVVCNGDYYPKPSTTYGTPEYSYHQPLGWKDDSNEDSGREKDDVSLDSRPGASQDSDPPSSSADLGGSSGVVLGADPLSSGDNLAVGTVVSDPLSNSANLGSRSDFELGADSLSSSPNPQDSGVFEAVGDQVDGLGGAFEVDNEDTLFSKGDNGFIEGPDDFIGDSGVTGDSGDIRDSGVIGDSGGFIGDSGDIIGESGDIIGSSLIGSSVTFGSNTANRFGGPREKLFVSFLDPLIGNERFTWYEANYECGIRGMELISIEDIRKNDWVSRLLSFIPNDHHLRITWTSGMRRRKGPYSDRRYERFFRWANGNPILRGRGFTSWGTSGPLGKDQPDNAFKNEYCLSALVAPDSSTAVWHDIACDDIAPFICQPRRC